jgi:hypothetical protein
MSGPGRRLNRASIPSGTYCALRQKPLTVLVRDAFIAEGNGSLETSAVGSSIDIGDFGSIVEGLTCDRYGVRGVGTIICGGGAIFDGGAGSTDDGGVLKDVG